MNAELSCGCAPGAHERGEPGGFYVTAKDHVRTAWLLGPYGTHDEALEHVSEGRDLALAATTRAHFWAFGTSRRLEGERPAGRLNERLAQWRASILAEGTLVQYRKVGRGTVTAHHCPSGYCARPCDHDSHEYSVAFETGRYRGTEVSVRLVPGDVTTRPGGGSRPAA